MYNYADAETKRRKCTNFSLPALKPNPQPVQLTYYRIYCRIRPCQEFCARSCYDNLLIIRAGTFTNGLGPIDVWWLTLFCSYLLGRWLGGRLGGRGEGLNGQPDGIGRSNQRLKAFLI